MARGQESKEKIIQKILSTFDGSFLNNGGKEIRIPMTEAGEPLEIKVTLTAAKDIVGAENATGSKSAPVGVLDWSDEPIKPTVMSAEDQAKVDSLWEMIKSAT